MPVTNLDTRLRRAPADAGSATIITLSAFLVLGTLTGAVLTVAIIAVCRQRAANAADMAALAAAGDPSSDPLSKCAHAHAIGLANHGRVLSCTTAGDTVEIIAAIELPGALRRFGPLVARARAGPGNGSTDDLLSSVPPT
jgi:secretion/DNA translocation related TadE-like protein